MRARQLVLGIGAVTMAACIATQNETASHNDAVTGGNTNATKGAGATPTFQSLSERCKLISNRNLDDPTANETRFRANLRGTDLGISVAHEGNLYFFFGDTAGASAIWSLGPESLPDSVGVAPEDAVANDPSALCAGLRFLTTPGSSAGHQNDPQIERDFAAASMTPPPGRSIAEFIHNPAGPRGANRFANLPGDFEVPSGAFSHDGSIYLFYTTVVSPQTVEMKASYLARWRAPSPDALPNYEILYHVDERFDALGALRGDFINVAPLVVGDWLYVFGSGEYRKSAVHLARKRLADLETEGGFERFDAATRAWKAPDDGSATPVADSDGVGELSVRFFPSLSRYVMMSQEGTEHGNQIVARFADAPEGPWSGPMVMATMGDPAFNAKYCCVDNDCSGERLFNCDRAGFYGTYMLPEATTHTDGSFDLHFLMSTWDPYNVALMSAHFSRGQ